MKVVLSILISLFVIACSENTPVEVHAIDTSEEKSTLEKADDKVIEVKEELKAKVTHAKEKVIDSVTEVKEEVSAKVSKSQELVIDKATKVVKKIKEKVADVSVEKIDADLLYNKCSGCHGGMGEQSAHGRSAVIRTWSANQINYALKGYRDGTYGRAMKDMMQSQVRNLSDAQLRALAEYITDR